MKKRLNIAFQCGFISFVVASILLTWLQGGGKYQYYANAHIQPLLYLYIALPAGIVVGIIAFVQESKK